MFSTKLLVLLILIAVANSSLIGSLMTGKFDRLNCSLNENLSESTCRERSCIWDPIGNEGPNCYFDVSKTGYNFVESHELKAGFDVDIEAKPDINKSLPPTIRAIENLRFEVRYLTDRIVRLKIVDPKHKRYEVPVQNDFPLLKNDPEEENDGIRKYEVIINSKVRGDNFGFSIRRRSTKSLLWDTSIGGLIYSDQFIQIATYLPSKNVYGFGENPHASFRHNLSYKTWPLFARDQMQTDGPKNAYSVHPFYTCLENDGKSHGVLLLNSNPMEYTLMPYPALNYRTTGGILDFFVFVGEDPEHVIQLYTQLIGRTYMPPKWGLGYQIARYGFTNLTYVQNVVDRNIKAQIPLDMMGLDIDYMDNYYDFTYDHKNFNGLPDYMHKTQKDLGLHWELIWNPEIVGNDSNYPAFQDGYKNDIFMKWPKEIPMSERHNPPGVPTDTDIIYGRMWPSGPSAYPDFFRNATYEWWKRWLNYTNTVVGLPLEGMWMDINEPRSFDKASSFCKNKNCYALQCPKNKYDDPPYHIIGNPIIWIDTLCLASTLGENNEYRHYDVHSIYGWSQTIPTLRALQEITGKRNWVLARSTYPSSGRYAAHWLGDNRSIFVDMHRSIIGLLEFNLFGIPWVGANICGHFGNTTPELCMRWHQLGAFYPFARNYNSFNSIDQDPAVFIERGHPEVTKDAQRVLNIRYSLLPYLYTLFYISHTRGNTVFRPLFHEFPTDSNTWGIDTQFLWGPSIMFSPFLYENQTMAKIYVPDDIWYDFYTFKKQSTGFSDITTAPGIHVRGGSIIPVQKPENNTKETDKNPINLYIFPKNNEARGQLFFDDSDAIDTIEKGEYTYIRFEMFKNCTLLMKRERSYHKPNQSLVLESVYLVDAINKTLSVKIDRKIRENAVKARSDGVVEVKLGIDLEEKYFTSVVFEETGGLCEGTFNN